MMKTNIELVTFDNAVGRNIQICRRCYLDLNTYSVEEKSNQYNVYIHFRSSTVKTNSTQAARYLKELRPPQLRFSFLKYDIHKKYCKKYRFCHY